MEDEIKSILNFWICNDKDYDVEYSGRVGVYLNINARAKKENKDDWKIIIDRNESGEVKCAANTIKPR